jgi:hypothetical protein
MITTDKQARKNAPVYSGCLAYFPKAITRLAQAAFEHVDDPDETYEDTLAKLLTTPDAEDRDECIAINALDLLQDELTGTQPPSWDGEAEGSHSFLVRYAEALLAVAELSRVGAEQHNPGKPLFWDRSKSGDELDALARHLLEAGKVDVDGVRHSTKVCWRALANLEKAIEREELDAVYKAAAPGVLGTVVAVEPDGSAWVAAAPARATLAENEIRSADGTEVYTLARSVLPGWVDIYRKGKLFRAYKLGTGRAYLSASHPCWNDATRARVEAWVAKHPPTPAHDPDTIEAAGLGTARMVSCTRDRVALEWRDGARTAWPLDEAGWMHSYGRHPKVLDFHKRHYKLEPGEYRDPETGLIKDMATDEVRLQDGRVVKLTWQAWSHPRQVYIGSGTGLYWSPDCKRLAFTAGDKYWALPEDQLPRVKAFYASHNTAAADRA